MRQRYDYDSLSLDLYTYMIGRPQGATIYEIATALGVPKRTADRTVHHFRVYLGEYLNLVADPDGQHRPWLYRLTGDFEEARPWINNRLGDMRTRVHTTEAIAASLVGATDGRSATGKRVRQIQRQLARLSEDIGLAIAESDDDGGTL